MNCKQGDLAIVTGAAPKSAGKIVTCVEYIGRLHFHTWISESDDVWRINTPLSWISDGLNDEEMIPYAPDYCLRPIRGLPQSEVDEILANPPYGVSLEELERLMQEVWSR